MALKWRSESACTAPAAPGLQLGPLSRVILHTPQPAFIFRCPRITNTRYNWCRALNTKAFPRCGTLLAQWGSVRGPGSARWQTWLESAEAGYSSQFPLCACNTISFKTDFMLCKCLEIELFCQTRLWMDTLYSLGKESVQNREFGLNKSLIKQVVYLELQEHTGHICVILHLSECEQQQSIICQLFLARVCGFWLQSLLRLMSLTTSQ